MVVGPKAEGDMIRQNWCFSILGNTFVLAAWSEEIEVVWHLLVAAHLSLFPYQKHLAFRNSPLFLAHRRLLSLPARTLAGGFEMPEERVVPRPKEDYSSQDESEFSEAESFEERPLPSRDETSEIELKLTRSKALLEFRCIVEDAIVRNYLFGPDRIREEDPKKVTLWGVPLLPSKGHPSTDVVLMNFLEAKRYKVPEAFNLLRKTMKWRRDYQVDQILDEKFSPELQSMWCPNGLDKEGRPICYHTLRAFKDREFRKKTWRSNEKLPEFLRWRIQCVEKEIKMLDFNPGATSSVIHIIDVKNTPRPTVNEIRWYLKKMVTMVYENYPGIISKTFVVNVPLWFFAVYAMNLKQIMQRSTQKAIFLRSPKVTETLLKSITPENLVARYGGLNRENDIEFSSDDKVLECSVQANTVERIQIPANEPEMSITWDVTVVGSDVTYKEEFVPNDDCSYRVLLQKEGKLRKNTIRNSFYIREPGEIVITIGNGTFKQRKVFYRSKSKPCLPVYTITK